MFIYAIAPLYWMQQPTSMLQHALTLLACFLLAGRPATAAPVSVPSSSLAVTDGAYAAWATLHPNPQVIRCCGEGWGTEKRDDGYERKVVYTHSIACWYCAGLMFMDRSYVMRNCRGHAHELAR
jgi:hypothetical protein